MPGRINRTLDLMVDNEFGVLTRITALVRRHGYNIRSLAASVTAENSQLSRLLLEVECPEGALDALALRLVRLDCVRSVDGVTRDFDLSGSLSEVFAGVGKERSYEAQRRPL